MSQIRREGNTIKLGIKWDLVTTREGKYENISWDKIGHGHNQGGKVSKYYQRDKVRLVPTREGRYHNKTCEKVGLGGILINLRIKWDLVTTEEGRYQNKTWYKVRLDHN